MRLHSSFTITYISLKASNRETTIIHQSVQMCDDDDLLTINLDDKAQHLTKSLS